MKNKLTDFIDKLKYRIMLLNGNEEFNIIIDIFKSYAKLDIYKGKTILDIGADFGLSPFFFIQMGAKRVIAYSPLRQRKWLKHPDIEWHRGYWQGEYIKADILKIDCEGCEYIHPVEWYMKNYNELLYAIHYDTIHSYEYYNYIKTLENDGAVLLLGYGAKELLYYWKRNANKRLSDYND